MKAKPKKKPAPKRRAAPKKKAAKAKPRFDLALTDRMKAAGYRGRWRYTGERCGDCGGVLATDGTLRWCVSEALE